jgi:hypothetical protein
MVKRPLAVTILGWFYMAVGVLGSAVHAKELLTQPVFQADALGVVLVSVLAVVAGVSMLRGRNWARSLALAWMAFHVIVSVFHSLRDVAVHAVLLALFTYLLFRPEATAYFRTPKEAS